MYGIVLMMALTNNGANPEAPALDVGPKPSYGNQLATEQYRGRRRRGCCGGGGGCSGYGGGGCSGGGGGYRRGYANNYSPNGGYYAYDQGYGQNWNQNMYGQNWNQNQPMYGQNWNQNQNMQDYQSFYAGPTDRNRDMPGRIVVFTHPDARLTIDGTNTQQMGNVREFESPPLKAGREFTYTLRAQMPGPDGQMQTVTRKVNIRPGMVTRTVLDPRVNNNTDNRERTRDENRPEEVRPPKPREEDK